MKSYELTIFNQSRVITVVFLFPVILLGSLFAGLELMPKSYFWIVSIPMFAGLSGLIYYFAKGDLIVDFDDETLLFNWKKKLIFNYDAIEPIPVKDIKTVVIDQGELLRKIITSDREVKISNGKLLMKDSQKFIAFLRSSISQNGGRVIDSWDVWQEKGYLKWALKINTVIIISIVGIIVAFGVIKGFDKIPPASFFMLVFLLPQILLYQRQMKEK
ncbi:hypothetical protein [Mangrovimonas cancribranchiae]|uniref:PH domain-containing protein n=1 Tax=Mangrovimonas cancribranchiae TaxID=3080055 RepID=A0AAU6P6D8_9FLAO